MKIRENLEKYFGPILFIGFSYIVSVFIENVFVFDENPRKWLIVFFLMILGYLIGVSKVDRERQKVYDDIFKELEERQLVIKTEDGEFLYTKSKEGKNLIDTLNDLAKKYNIK